MYPYEQNFQIDKSLRLLNSFPYSVNQKQSMREKKETK